MQPQVQQYVPSVEQLQVPRSASEEILNSAAGFGNSAGFVKQQEAHQFAQQQAQQQAQQLAQQVAQEQQVAQQVAQQMSQQL